MMEWITDRQPTKEDEDGDGEVLMQRFPDGRNCSSGFAIALVAAAHVGRGVPWKRTAYWEPPAAPEPEPEAPKPAPKPELRVGQVWRSREGDEVTVTFKDNSLNLSYPFRGSNGKWYTSSGFWLSANDVQKEDLIELITDTPTEAPQPEPAPTTRKVPRLFAEPIRRTFLPSGDILIDAIADDGTAWFLREGEAPAPCWHQIPPLPDREEPIDV